MPENWLLIETSGRAGRVGLARGAVVVADAPLDPARRPTRDLAATVGAALAGAGLRPADLTGVMVSVGPGSYTGLRVGVMSAKALAYATGCLLVPVPTFAAIALQAPAEAPQIWVIADALQGQIYLQRFARDAAGSPPVPVDELRIDRAEEWLKRAADDVWLTGPGVKVYADRDIPPGCRLVPEADREPTVESLFRAGRAVRAVSRDELFALEPLYLRGSSAEEKAKQNEVRG